MHKWGWGLRMANGHRRSFDSISKRWALLVGVCCLPLLFVFAYLGDTGRGMAAAISAYIIAVAVRYFWDLRRRIWFWVTIALIVCLHAALVRFIAWPDRDYRGVQLLPIGLLDFAVAYGVIRLVENVFEGRIGRAGGAP